MRKPPRLWWGLLSQTLTLSVFRATLSQPITLNCKISCAKHTLVPFAVIFQRNSLPPPPPMVAAVAAVAVVCFRNVFWIVSGGSTGSSLNNCKPLSTITDPGLLGSAPCYLVSQYLRCLSIFPPSLNSPTPPPLPEYHLCWFLGTLKWAQQTTIYITVKGHGWLEGSRGGDHLNSVLALGL